MSIQSSQISDDALEKSTGKPWSEWWSILESSNAKDLDHKDIASLLNKQHSVPGWWAQMLTVKFEQEIGRRVPGQRADGKHEVGASKTLPGSMDGGLNWWLEKVRDTKNFNGVELVHTNTSQTEKWRYWNAKLADGTRVAVSIYQKNPDKASLGLGHEKIKTAESAEEWKQYWRDFLNDN